MDQKTESDKCRAHEMECIRRRLFADTFLESARKPNLSGPEIPLQMAQGALAGFDKAFPKKD